MGKIGLDDPVVKRYETLSEDRASLERRKEYYEKKIYEYNVEIRGIERQIKSVSGEQDQLSRLYNKVLTSHYDQSLFEDLIAYGCASRDRNIQLATAAIQRIINTEQGDKTIPITNVLVLQYLRQIEKSIEESRGIWHLIEVLGGISLWNIEKQEEIFFDENYIKWKESNELTRGAENKNNEGLTEIVRTEEHKGFVEDSGNEKNEEFE